MQSLGQNVLQKEVQKNLGAERPGLVLPRVVAGASLRVRRACHQRVQNFPGVAFPTRCRSRL
jgi:hypothetical protein